MSLVSAYARHAARWRRADPEPRFGAVALALIVDPRRPLACLESRRRQHEREPECEVTEGVQRMRCRSVELNDHTDRDADRYCSPDDGGSLSASFASIR